MAIFELTGDELVHLESILHANRRRVPDEDAEILGQLERRASQELGEGDDDHETISEPETYEFYTESEREDEVLHHALNWAVEDGRRVSMVKDIQAKASL